MINSSKRACRTIVAFNAAAESKVANLQITANKAFIITPRPVVAIL